MGLSQQKLHKIHQEMQIQHLQRQNPLQEYSLETDRLGSSSAKKDLGSCGQQVGHKPAVCLVSQNNQIYPGLHW